MTTISVETTPVATLRQQAASLTQQLGDLNDLLDDYAAAKDEERRQARIAVNQELLASLDPERALADLTAAGAELHAALNNRLAAQARVRAARRHLDEAKALVFLNGVEGKNEAERNARLTILLRDSVDYQTALRDLDDAEAAADEADARIEALRQQTKAAEARVKLVTESLRLLAL